MRYPKPVKPNSACSRIKVVATSLGISKSPYEECLEEAKKKLTDKGYAIKVDELVYGNDLPFLAASPNEMGQHFNELYASDKCDMLISAAGGEFMCEMLDHVDFELIVTSEPKWFMGFSDNTNLTFLLPTICDTAAVYGPGVCEFAMQPWHRCLHAALRSIGAEEGEAYAASGYHYHQGTKLRDEEHPFADYNVTIPNEISYLNATKGEPLALSGRTLGGCLDVLVSFPGTPYDRMRTFQAKYANDGIIWMLEPCDLNVTDIRRALWHLDHAGWFRTAKGFVFGRAKNAEDIDGYSYLDAVADALAAYDVPILVNCDLGHVPPSIPFIEGALSEIKVKGDRLTLTQKLI